jgi:hypothetical protein
MEEKSTIQKIFGKQKVSISESRLFLMIAVPSGQVFSPKFIFTAPYYYLPILP